VTILIADLGPIRSHDEFQRLCRRYDTLERMDPPFGSPEFMEMEMLGFRLTAWRDGRDETPIYARADNDDSFTN
jgi:hypothetical protein